MGNMATDFITSGAQRIKDAIAFSEDHEAGMTAVYRSELAGWKRYYQILSAIETGIKSDDDFARELKSRAMIICQSCLLKM